MKGHRARKRFGQNFLHDAHVIQRIVTAIRPQPGDRLVEIGPGRGALTRPLLEAAGRIDVIELDRDLPPLLQAHCQGAGELIIHGSDALKFDFATLGNGTAGHKLRIVGNLPYNISTPLLFHLLDYADMIQDMHFMLQKEVVERLTAHPGGRDYGRLSIMVQYHCQAEYLFTVKPGSFTPVPKVDSAIVRLTPHPQIPVRVEDSRDFDRLVRAAFAMRRKTLRNNLRNMLDATLIEALGIDPSRRAETLTLAELASLANAYSRRDNGDQ
jgi:16S rRNA (adenine1518-N6/adenine1519-N6)-dimethyltransferase